MTESLCGLKYYIDVDIDELNKEWETAMKCKDANAQAQKLHEIAQTIFACTSHFFWGE
jgi:hypothetical protein